MAEPAAAHWASLLPGWRAVVGASADDGFDVYGFVGYAVGTALVEGLAPVAFEGVVVVAELGGPEYL
ncbi:hypothetical protein ACFVQ4_32735 [Streptomyces laurentii]|uniref:hypothetical protein n=1 Tax=Streptomyces laurentii TaxID=39478 RepID=UPI0036C65864